jgi:hypothetical protein
MVEIRRSDLRSPCLGQLFRAEVLLSDAESYQDNQDRKLSLETYSDIRRQY